MPATTPVATPVDALMVAIPVLLLLQVPPAVALVRVVVVAGHALSVPPIPGGAELILTIVVALQPEADEKLIVEVPAATPVTMPEEEPMVATEVLLLVHVPPLVASVSVVVWPVHTLVVPAIAAGVGFTVIL